MIQLYTLNASQYPLLSNTFYLDLYDKFTGQDATNRVMVSLTSQFTGKTKTLLASTGYTNKERYISCGIVTVRNPDLEDFSQNKVLVGTTDFPLGFYDITLYENKDNTNLDPSEALATIYNGLMNLSVNTIFSGGSEPPVKYTEYTTNDADTESIYLTNPL